MKTEILRLDNFGRGITFYKDKICFIENTYPNEIIEFEITKETSKYYEGKAIKITKPSSNRVESKCKYSNICGGCSFQEYKYDEENKFKEDKIKSLVKTQLKQKNIVKKIEYDKDYFYRNKITLHGSNNNLGLYKNKTNEIINIDECNITNKRINAIIEKLKKYNDIKEVLVRTSNDEKQVIIDIKGKEQDYKELEEISDVLIINNKLITKNKSIITNIGSKKYYLSSNSFFQVNEFLTNKLFNNVLEYVKEIKPSNVLDLYCGTGSFGIYISEYANKIIGVDYNKSNIEDAIKNKELNNIKNIDFIADKVENIINKFDNYDLIIVDPPRSGLDKKTIEYMIKINPKYIIYISCDPNTLVRDLKLLNKEYIINEITPYNLFPKTYHVESVSVLERKSVEK